MSNDFCYTQAEVDELAGAPVSTEGRVEGVEWERRVRGRGFKIWWHKSVYESLKPKQQGVRAMLELDEKGMRIVFPEIKPEDWRPPTPESETIVPVEEQKIVRIYPNFKWVDTNKGRVWVGLKGKNMKRGQTIRVKNGELFLGKTGPSSSLVRVS